MLTHAHARRLGPALIALALTLASHARAADEPGFTQAAAHEHGKVTVNLAIEAGTLSVELLTPALHVLGFEHAARTDAERARIVEAGTWLRSGTGILAVPAAAGCRLHTVDLELPDLAATGKHDHDHDHDHDHGSKGEAAGTEHADYRGRYSYRCSNVAALAWTELALLRRLREVETAQVNLITAGGQARLDVRKATLRIPLR